MITEVPDGQSSGTGLFADCLNVPDLDHGADSSTDHKYSLGRSSEAMYKPHLLSGGDHFQESNERKHLYMHHDTHTPDASIGSVEPLKRRVNYNGKVLDALANEKTPDYRHKLLRDWALENRDRSVKDQITDVVGFLEYPDGFSEQDSDSVGTMSSVLSGFPGGLSMPSTHARKYFGTEARLQFFERQKWLSRQREICTTSRFTKASSLPLQQQFLKDPTSDEGDFPFRPVRNKSPVKLSTKVVIRTQTLLEGESCESQIKLVAKRPGTSASAVSSITSGSPLESARSTLTGDGSLDFSNTFGGDKNGPSSPRAPTIAQSRTSSSAAKGGTTPSKALRPLVFDSSSSLHKSQLKKPSPQLDPIIVPPNSVTKLVHFAASEENNHMRKSTVKNHSKPHKQLALSLDVVQQQAGIKSRKEDDKNGFPKKDIDFDDWSNNSSPIQLVCVDHRDKFNRKVKENLQKNSLFQYVESKSANRDFKDSDSDSDEGSFNDEMSSIISTNVFGTSKRDGKTDDSISTSLTSQSQASQQLEEEVQLSPRSNYIDSCIRQKLNPRLSLILRKNFTKVLSLQHHGIGDDMAVLLSQAISGIPYIQSLNIADNNLTDKGLGPVVEAATGMKDLIDLNLSFNTIGPNAASCLSSYLSRPDCPLKRLVLRRADVDDGECERFVTALLTNRHLTELDLSENLLGSSEQLNTVLPDITTGGEALAELLSSETCVLESLKLGWNMIRLDSGIQLCESLSVNKTLTYLDLSFNALGCEGGIALGSSLQDNKTLRYLLVANNALDSRACIAICAGILENHALKEITLDGNPIGEEGAKALMLLPTMVGSRVDISAASCNISIKDSNCKYDLGNILRTYELKLDDPFSRAIAIFVIQLVAVHQSYYIATSGWVDDAGKTHNLDLVEKVVVDFDSKRLDENQRKSVRNLQRVVDSNESIHKAAELFCEIDKDGSGQLDEQEFTHLLESLGFETTEEKVQEIIDEYDGNQDSLIELSEFLLFMRSQLREIQLKLKELTEFPIISMKSNANLERYVPPRHGILKLNVVDGFKQKPTYRVINDSDRKCIDLLASQSGDVVTMTAYGVQSYKIRLGEALGVVATMLKETSNRSMVLSKVLPQVATAEDARKVMAKTMKNSKTEISRTRREIGNFARPILGCPDGYYELDLSDAKDRQCLTKLFEISKTRSHFRSQSPLGYGAVGDCSQKGNWAGFRNEMFRGKPIEISTDFVSPMPRSGKIEFDFVSEKRFKKDDLVLQDGRVVSMLIQLYQLKVSERQKAVKRLQKSVVHTDRTLRGDGRSAYECPSKRAREIGEHMFRFYDNLALRHGQAEAQKLKEKVTSYEGIDERIAEMEGESNFNQKTASSLVPILSLRDVKDLSNGEDHEHVNVESQTGRKSTRRSAEVSIPQQVAQLAQAAGKSKSVSAPTQTTSAPTTERGGEEEHFDFDEDEIESEDSDDDEEEPPTDTTAAHVMMPINEVASTGDNASEHSLESAIETHSEEIVPHAEVVRKKTEKKLDEWMLRYVRLVGSTNNSPHAKAAKILEVLVEAFEYSFVMARHLELMLDLFQEFGTVKATELFGTYRVELVVALFGCVVDLHNFEIVMRALSPFEAACVYCRIGWLHIYNPMKPQGAYELDLSRREERTVFKTLATLSLHEPGDSFQDVSFRWERQMDPMPGFELTVNMMTEEGLHRKGIFNVTYVCGDGKKKVYKPAMKLRKSMLYLVLVNEDELVKDADRDKEGLKLKLEGEAHMKANLGIWYGYLAYNEEEYQKIKVVKDAPATKKKKK